MAKIKHTKNELKAQREALERYERFLPMLQLKKQQLQLEIQTIESKLKECEQKAEQERGGLRKWATLLSEPIPIEDLLSIEGIDTEEGNIAGVAIPVLRDVRLAVSEYDLFITPPWVDDAMGALSRLVRLQVESDIFAEQRRLITEELRITNQRVNLFEKVKIPECRENIRVIRIFLGDEQTAAVARGKLAKSRIEKYQYDDEDAA